MNLETEYDAYKWLMNKFEENIKLQKVPDGFTIEFIENLGYKIINRYSEIWFHSFDNAIRYCYEEVARLLTPHMKPLLEELNSIRMEYWGFSESGMDQEYLFKTIERLNRENIQLQNDLNKEFLRAEHCEEIKLKFRK